MAQDKFGKPLRDRVVHLYNRGMSQKDISELLEIHKSSVSRIIKQFRTTGSVEVFHRGGNNTKTTPRQDAKLLRTVQRDPFLSSPQLKEELNLPISVRSIQRRILNHGLRARRPAKKPLVSEVNRQKRLDFAKQHKDWTPTQWRNVLFTDESKFNMKGADGNLRVRRPPKSRYDYRYCLRTVKYGGGGVMVWGCFSYAGVGPIHRIEGIMNALMYKDILNDVMLPYAEEEMPLRWVFQQDNDPKHTAKTVKSWFLEKQLNVMVWPPQSPDLNPIENLWQIVDRWIDRSNIRSKDELFRRIQSAWNGVPQDTITKLINSMPSRCAAVIQNNGYPTKY